MLRGIYSAVAAMRLQETRVDVASNNLANVDSTGFRKRLASVKSFPELDMIRRQNEGSDGSIESIGFVSGSVVLASTVSDLSAGEVVPTGDPLDCAICGEGFFRLSDDEGNFYYSRAGNFSIDGEGRLVNPSGLVVDGDAGPVEVGDAAAVTIREDGAVIADGEEVARIGLFRFAEPTLLQQLGSNLMQETPDAGFAGQVPEEEVVFATGAVEGSNVNVVEEMTRMVEATRAYEAVAQALGSEDETSQKLIQTFGS